MSLGLQDTSTSNQCSNTGFNPGSDLGGEMDMEWEPYEYYMNNAPGNSRLPGVPQHHVGIGIPTGISYIT
ncbi:unnamed protein product [Merluccius merluccius]